MVSQWGMKHTIHLYMVVLKHCLYNEDAEYMWEGKVVESIYEHVQNL